MSKIITLPNLITTLRIVLAPVFVITMLLGGFYTIAALIIITIAAITDFYDGKLARKYKLVSKLGTFLDPLADKILLSSVFLTFYVLNLIPFFLVFIIIFREFLITSLRTHYLLIGKQIETLHIGKIKTTTQFVSIYLMIFYVLLQTFFQNPFLSTIAFNTAYASFIIATMVTASSGIIYLVKNNRFSEFVSTVSFIGYFPIAPGTFASLVTTIALYFTQLTPIYPKILFVIIVFIVGLFSAEKLSNSNKVKDPKYIVIDEICAMALVLFFTPKTIYYYALAFILFRFFDITKFPFINKIEEKFDSGFGIMFDDIVAAFFSIIIITTIKYLQTLA